MKMPAYHLTIADIIKAYHNKKNLLLKEFSKLIGVFAQAACKCEQNTRYPDIIFLPHLARILECTIDDFFAENVSDPN